jgi:hypothetical protein
MASERAGAETRRVQQNDPGRPNRRMPCICYDDMLPAAPSAPQVLGQPSGALAADLSRQNASFPPQSDRFSARGGTGIVDERVLGRIHHSGQERLGRILNDEVALMVAGKLVWTSDARNDAGTVRGGLDLYSSGLPTISESFQALSRCLDDQSRPLVVPPQQSFGLFRSEQRDPAFNQPNRMGVRLRQSGGKMVSRGGWTRAGPGKPSQYGIHESGDSVSTGILGECHTGVDGSMRRYSLQLGQLVGSESQDILQVGPHSGPAPRHQRREVPIEDASVTQYSSGQFMGQPPVGLGKITEYAIECSLERLSFPHLLQDLQCCSPRIRAGR